ncbi:MAG: YggT family protein [Cardiobacteriaceae bacterium]|nr:YggT family protein [Cardiobacteriaceae bacterium]
MALLFEFCEIVVAIFFVLFHCELERRIFGNPIYSKLKDLTEPLLKPLRQLVKRIQQQIPYKLPFDPTTLIAAFLASILLGLIVLHSPLLALRLFIASWLGLQFCAILVSVLASWLQTPEQQPLLQTAEACQYCYMRYLRRFVPPIAGIIDITPVIALLLISVFQQIFSL